MPGQSPPCQPCAVCTVAQLFRSSCHRAGTQRQGNPFSPGIPSLRTRACSSRSLSCCPRAGVPWAFHFTASPWACISYEPASKYSTHGVRGQGFLSGTAIILYNPIHLCAGMWDFVTQVTRGLYLVCFQNTIWPRAFYTKCYKKIKTEKLVLLKNKLS